MSERKVLLLMSLGLLVLAVVLGAWFFATGCTSVVLLFAAAAFLIGSFMSFAVSFAA